MLLIHYFDLVFSSSFLVIKVVLDFVFVLQLGKRGQQPILQLFDKYFTFHRRVEKIIFLPMRGLGSGHVTCGPMRGLEINFTQTHVRTDGHHICSLQYKTRTMVKR